MEIEARVRGERLKGDWLREGADIYIGAFIA